MENLISSSTWMTLSAGTHGAMYMEHMKKQLLSWSTYTAFDLLQCMEQSPLTAAVWSMWSRCTNFPTACVAVPISEQKEHSNVASAFLEHMLQGICAPLLYVP